ncbi:hypothetical protein LPJ66_005281 [Kickxella alabastrina]|uniref:Uncharacterized protein n=1 Tax=Kickxella alabastrina TaxID=61397 RepID=A0ACC1IMR2_9FUNG|nr:hypothetical protein LPJ66_005281 [Kickxella alabastrina]
MDNLSKARLENIKLLQLPSGRNASRYHSVTAVTTTAVTVAASSTSASAASDDQLKQMHREIKVLRIQLETAAADNSNLYAQNEKLRADIAAATTTAEDVRADNKNLCAQLDVANANTTLLIKKLNDADLESQRKVDLYYKQRSIAYAHATMVENKCGRLEGELRPIQVEVAAANDIADTLCKQLEDARAELGAFAGINAQLAEVEADNKRVKNKNADLRAQLQDVNALYNQSQRHILSLESRIQRAEDTSQALETELNGSNVLLNQSQTRISQLERRISRAAKANKSLENELADFSSKISGILAEHNERDRNSTAIVVSLKRALSKAKQQLHSNDLCKRGLINHNIITQRSDERTHVLVDWATREPEYQATMQRSEHIEAESMGQTEASNGHLAESMEHSDAVYESRANSSTRSFARRPSGPMMGDTPLIWINADSPMSTVTSINYRSYHGRDADFSSNVSHMGHNSRNNSILAH